MLVPVLVFVLWDLAVANHGVALTRADLRRHFN
jgi:hypothetical protein